MKNLKKNLTIGLSIALIIGCGKASEEKIGMYTASEEKAGMYAEKAATDTIVAHNEDVASSSAAVERKDSTKKFIRTAELKFKVKDVRSSTFAIEDIINQFNGFVTYTNLFSTIDRRTVIPISNDSSLETTYYTVQNEMVIRVPNVKLDSTLKAIAKQINYLDYRIIKAEDVTLTLLSNNLNEKRLLNHEERLKTAIDNRGKKLNETSNAEENLLNKQTLADNSKIASLTIKDQISYSTITLNIYQRQAIQRELIENDKNIEAYKPSFFHELKESFTTGWMILEHIILFFIKAWGFLIIGLLGFIAFKIFFSKKK